MSPGELLRCLRDNGFQCQVRGSDLLLSPRDGLTDELRAAIAEHREQLIGLLKNRALGFPEPPARCPVCGGVNFYQRLEDGTWGCLSCFPEAARSAAVLHFGPVPHIPQGSKVVAA